MTKQIRNIAIIAHVDHGKTTMVDQLLRQSGTFADHEKVVDTVMDNNAIEKERGITILAKNCAVSWKGTHINIVDTPGHADFGGEVERALSMVDSVVLLIDAQEGPMPQTRFVTKKALALGLRPILVVNKVDKPGANPDKVVNAAFDLFDKLGATDEQLDFPVVYASGINGWSSLEEGAPGEQWGPDMSALFDTILKHVPPNTGNPDAPLQLQISALDFSTFVGRIGVGRISQGTLKPMQDVVVMEGPGGKAVKGRVNQVLTFQGLDRMQTPVAGPGDIVLINGGISDLIAGMAQVNAGQLTADAFRAQARQWGVDLATQVRRITEAGGTHVVLAGVYDLSRTPWAAAIGQQALLKDVSRAFNTGLQVSLTELGNKVQYVDLEYYVNLYTDTPSSFSFDNATQAVCTSVDAGNGIGTM